MVCIIFLITQLFENLAVCVQNAISIVFFFFIECITLLSDIYCFQKYLSEIHFCTRIVYLSTQVL